MAFVTTHYIRTPEASRSAIKEIVDSGTYSVRISVNTKGQFTCPLPKLFDPYVNAELKREDHRIIGGDGNYKATAPSLQQLQDYLQILMDRYLATTQKTTLVIHYAVTTNVSFGWDDGGEIAPNGCASKSFAWADESLYHVPANYQYSDQVGYSIGLYAKALKRIDTISADGKIIDTRYENYYGEGGNHMRLNTPAEKLNAWTRMYSRRAKVEEIPYSDEAALYFHNCICQMVEQAVKLRSYFDKPELLLENMDKVKLIGG